jgi:hypothetical protein
MLILCFAFVYSAQEELISKCPEAYIHSFKGLSYVNPTDVKYCDLALGVNSWSDHMASSSSGTSPAYILNYTIINNQTYNRFAVGYLTNRLVYLDVNWEDLNVSFYRRPWRMETEWSGRTWGTAGTVSYNLTYYNSTHILMHSTTEDFYFMYYNGSKYSDYLEIGLSAGTINQVDFTDIQRENDENTNSTFPAIEYRTAFSELTPRLAFGQYMVCDDQPQDHIGYIMGRADPLDNYIVDTPDTYNHFDFMTFASADICGVYLVGDTGYGLELLNPSLSYTTYNPADPDGNGFVMASWYDPNTYYAYMWPNSPTFLIDEVYGYWWFVPPLDCIQGSPITANMLRITDFGEVEEGGEWDMPTIPSSYSCVIDDEFKVKSTSPTSVSHIISIYSIDGENITVENLEYGTNNFDYSFTMLNNTVKVSHFIGTYKMCEWVNGTTSVFGIPSFTLPDGWLGDYNWLLATIFSVSIVVSLFMPYFIAFSLVWNDIFSVIDPYMMGSLIVLVGLVSAIISWTPSKTFNLKQFICFAIFGVVFILYAFNSTGSGVDPASFSGFTELNSAYNSLNIILSNPDPASMLASSVSFILSMISFCLLAPAHIVNFVGSLLLTISAPIGNTFMFLKNIIILSIYAVVVAKGYEILSNRQIEI